jgi:hypothetical protein
MWASRRATGWPFEENSLGSVWRRVQYGSGFSEALFPQFSDARPPPRAYTLAPSETAARKHPRPWETE